jgi:hypothetical protein
MGNKEILAYLDHNVLDLMTKGDPHKVKEFLKMNDITPVYSNETMKEIQRSVGYENNFIELLDDIGAKYIKPILNQSSKLTGFADVHSVSPKLCYESFLSNQKGNPIDDFGLSKILMKFYGGHENTSFSDILKQGSADLQKCLMDALEGIEELPLDKSINIENLKTIVAKFTEMMPNQLEVMSKELDNKAESPLIEFEKAMELGPLVLNKNNISPPNVVEKIWKIVSVKLDSPEIDIDTFFGVKAYKFEEDFGRERTLQEKVNAIYHQLNFLGYCRDSKIKKERGFRASFSDMTHAGIASFCHFFLCRDENLVMKAAAAFEYLGVKTKILYYKPTI